MTRRVVAIAMVKDESDIVEGWAQHLAAEVDHIVVADNRSTDGTREILDRLIGTLPLTVLDDEETAYHQSQKMSALAELAAREHGAEWIVPADADELWFAPGGRIREVLNTQGPVVTTAAVALTNHFRTRALDVDDPDPFRSMVWRQRRPAPLGKVAFRWEPAAVLWQGNHGVTLPLGGGTVAGALEIRHFPYRSPEQMITKARNGALAYAATDLPETEGAHWRAYGGILDRLGEPGLHDVFNTHFCYLSPTDSGLVRDAAPYLRWSDPVGR